MSFSHLFILSLGAILAENFICVKHTCGHTAVSASKKVKPAFLMGLTVLFVMTAASVCAASVGQILHRFNVPALHTVVFIVFFALILQIGEIVLKKAAPALYSASICYLPLLLVNCAVLSAAIGLGRNEITVRGSLVSAAAAGGSFIVAIVLFASIRERLRFSDYPESFNGFPIALTTAALLSIAFFGLHGIKL
jgi:electron transport complex protein RnfA